MPNYNQILDEQIESPRQRTKFVEKRFYIHMMHLGGQMLLAVVIGGVSTLLVGDGLPDSGFLVFLDVILELFVVFLVSVLFSIFCTMPMYKQATVKTAKTQFGLGTLALGIIMVNIRIFSIIQGKNEMV